MRGFLLNWKRKRKGGFDWVTLTEDAASTLKGVAVPTPWWVYKQKSICAGDRVFVLAQGGGYLKPKAENGIIAAGYSGPVPKDKSPLIPGSVVFNHRNWREGNYILADLDVILMPDRVLPIDELLNADGPLRHVPWKNTQSPGSMLKPTSKLGLKVDVLPDLEVVWAKHLKKIGFPIPPLNENGNRNDKPRQQDPERRKLVEENAVNLVWDWYKANGYKIKNRQNDNCGWDLDAFRGSEHLKLEVKGLSPTDLNADLTVNEYEKMMATEHRVDYLICNVLDALNPVAANLHICRYDPAAGTWVSQDGRVVDVQPRTAARLRWLPVQ